MSVISDILNDRDTSEGLLNKPSIDDGSSFYSSLYNTPKKEDRDISSLEAGVRNVVSSGKYLGYQAIGDDYDAAQILKERSKFQNKLEEQKTEGEREISEAWNRDSGFFDSIANVFNEMGSSFEEGGFSALGEDVSYLAGGLAEQLPNMVPAMGGMATGAAVGSLAGPVGTVIGSLAGGLLGNAVVETAGIAEDKARAEGINLADPDETEEFLRKNKWQILKESGIKSGVVSSFDMLSMYSGRLLMKGPSEVVATKLLNKMGVDVADKKAVQAAMKSTVFKKDFLADPLIQKATSKVAKIAKAAGEQGLEMGGEFGGEFVGSGLAQGKWDVKEAGLEALSSIGQSAITVGGQYGYNAAKGTTVKLTAAQKIKRAEMLATERITPTGDKIVDETNHANEAARIMEEEVAGSVAQESVQSDVPFLKKKIKAKEERVKNLKKEFIARQERAANGGTNTDTVGLAKIIKASEEEVTRLKEEVAKIEAVANTGEETATAATETPKEAEKTQEAKPKEEAKPAKEEELVRPGKAASAAILGDTVEETTKTQKPAKEETKTARQTVAEYETLKQEQENRQKLLSDKKAMKAKALEVGVPVSELTRLTAENYNNNKSRLSDLEKEVKSKEFTLKQKEEKQSASNIKFKETTPAASKDVQKVQSPAKEKNVKPQKPESASLPPKEAAAIQKEIAALGEMPDNKEDAIDWRAKKKKLERQLKKVQEQPAAQPAVEVKKGVPHVDTEAMMTGEYNIVGGTRGKMVPIIHSSPVGTVESKGRKVNIKGLNRETYLVKVDNKWEVIDKKTGRSISNIEKTQDAAIKSAIKKISTAKSPNAVFDMHDKKISDTKQKLYSKAKEDISMSEVIPEGMTHDVEVMLDDGETTKVTMDAKEAYQRLLSQRKKLKNLLDCVKS